MTATISIFIEGHRGSPHLISLFGWLDRDPTLRRNATIATATLPGGPDPQSAVDIINLVLSNAIAAGSLAAAIRSWRQAQPAAAPITITVGDVTITVPDASPESLAVLEQALRAALDADNDGTG